MTRTIDDVLSACQLFEHVGLDRRRRVAAFSVTRKFPKGRMIFRQGDDCPGIYVVDAGVVRIFKTGPSGKEHVLHMISPGNTFAEVAAIGNFPCPAHAEAIAATSCVLVPLAPFRREIQTDHQLCLEMMTGLSQWVRRLISLMEDLVLRDAIGRTAQYLLEAETDASGAVQLPSLKRYVASHLNLTSETFSRTLSRLIEAGLVVELEGNRVELTDRAKLRDVSNGQFAAV